MRKKAYPLKDAVEVLAKFPKAKFNETDRTRVPTRR